MARKLGRFALVVALAVSVQGCATGGNLNAVASVNYTLDGIAYRTFNAPIDQMRRATLSNFKRLALELKSEEIAEDGCHELVAANGDRTIHVELDRLAARTTRMRITAKQGWMVRDRATAGEFIVMTERALDDTPAVTQRAK